MRIERRVHALMSRQNGLITRQQAAALGLTNRMISYRLHRGDWIRVHPGVFRIAGTEVSRDQALLAALLWAGDGSALSHRTAASLLELPGGDPSIIELTSTRNLRSRSDAVHCHATSAFHPRDIEATGALRRTSVIRTLADLGTCLPRHMLESALDDALRRKLTTLRRLRQTLERPDMLERRGVAYLRHLVSAEDVTESVLERMTVRLLRSSAILPPPSRQFELPDERGRKLRFDFAYPEARLAIEADGYRFHSDLAAWDRDLGRRNLIAAHGWAVFHVTWKALKTRPDRVLRDIEDMYLSGSALVSGRRMTKMYKLAE